MSLKNIVLTIIDLAVWYFFVWYWLYCIKNAVFLPVSSGMLILMAVLGVVLCPLFYKSEVWRKLREK